MGPGPRQWFATGSIPTADRRNEAAAFAGSTLKGIGMNETLDHATATYVAFFESLSDRSVDDLRQLASPEMRYRDPLTDSRGIDAVTDYMHRWFQTMDDLSFDVDLLAVHGNVALSHSNMNFRIRRMPKHPWTN